MGSDTFYVQGIDGLKMLDVVFLYVVGVDQGSLEQFFVHFGQIALKNFKHPEQRKNVFVYHINIIIIPEFGSQKKGVYFHGGQDVKGCNADMPAQRFRFTEPFPPVC